MIDQFIVRGSLLRYSVTECPPIPKLNYFQERALRLGHPFNTFTMRNCQQVLLFI